MSFLSQPKTFKLRNTYVNGFLDCSGDILLRAGNVIIGNISQPGYNANQLSVLVHGRTQMNGNVIVNGNLLVSSNNIALGLRAGNIVNGIQDGVPNGLNTTAVGSFSGMNHTGLNNTFVGSVAGQTSSTTYLSRTGSNNTYLGYRTSANNTAWGNSTAVGTGAVITASNQIVLGTAEEIVTTGGNVRITNQTNSTNTTSGALQVSGGVGVGGAIIAAGSIYAGSGNNRAVELAADDVNTAYIDFHSLDAVSNDFDSRIKSVGGTSGTSSRGALSLESHSVTITGNTTMNNNIQMGTGAADYQQFSLGGGNSFGYIYGAFAKHGDGISLAYNYYNNNTSNVIYNAGLSTSRLFLGYGFISLYTGGNGVEPTNLGLHQDYLGKVGIGTTAPSQTLDVAGTQRIVSSTHPQLTIKTPAAIYSGGKASIYFEEYDGTNPMGKIECVDVAVNQGVFQNDMVFYSGINVALYERMRIKGTGNTGIGTTAPAATLHVRSPSKANMYTEDSIFTANSADYINGDGNNTIYSAAINLNAADLVWNSGANRSYGSKIYIGGGMSVNAAVNHNVIAMSTAGAERLRIAANGYVGIGTTDPTVPLRVAGTGTSTKTGSHKFSDFNTSFGISTTGPPTSSATGSITISAQSGIDCDFIRWYSDKRIKTNILPMDNPFELLRKMNCCQYNYIDKVDKPYKRFGFIAQEIEEILPQAIGHSSEYIPNIYEFANINGNIITLNTKTTNDINCELMLQIVDDDKDVYVNIDKIINDKSFSIKISEDTKIVSKENKIFVYGQQINDFKSINYNEIFTITTACLKEIDNMVTTHQQKFEEQKITIQNQQQTIQNLEQRLSLLEQRLL